MNRIKHAVRPPVKPKRNYHRRWMIRRDLPRVLAIEGVSFENPWSEEDFIRCLRQRNCIGQVIEDCPPYKGASADLVIGFVLYELHKNRLHILNFAIDPWQRRNGVGSYLLTFLKDKLHKDRRNRIMLEVRESNLDAQLFFARNGFKAISTLHDFYEDTSEDAYLFQFKIEP